MYLSQVCGGGVGEGGLQDRSRQRTLQRDETAVTELFELDLFALLFVPAVGLRGEILEIFLTAAGVGDYVEEFRL